MSSQNHAQAKPCLGLVCITTSKDVRYRTVTRKRLLEHLEAGQRKILDDIYRDNLQTLDGALQYARASSAWRTTNTPTARPRSTTYA